jgi:hypothetical protein
MHHDEFDFLVVSFGGLCKAQRVMFYNFLDVPYEFDFDGRPKEECDPEVTHEHLHI